MTTRRSSSAAARLRRRRGGGRQRTSRRCRCRQRVSWCVLALLPSYTPARPVQSLLLCLLLYSQFHSLRLRIRLGLEAFGRCNMARAIVLAPLREAHQRDCPTHECRRPCRTPCRRRCQRCRQTPLARRSTRPQGQRGRRRRRRHRRDCPLSVPRCSPPSSAWVVRPAETLKPSRSLLEVSFPAFLALFAPAEKSVETPRDTP